jgi:hypothetical protein
LTKYVVAVPVGVKETFTDDGLAAATEIPVENAV